MLIYRNKKWEFNLNTYNKHADDDDRYIWAYEQERLEKIPLKKTPLRPTKLGRGRAEKNFDKHAQISK